METEVVVLCLTSRQESSCSFNAFGSLNVSNLASNSVFILINSKTFSEGVFNLDNSGEIL
jgi:hypothetical protein